MKIQNGQHDAALEAVVQGLAAYGARHAKAKIEARRPGRWSMHVRVIDPDFRGVDEVDRFDLIWSYLEQLPEKTATQVSRLVLLTPAEARKSLLNQDFEELKPTAVS